MYARAEGSVTAWKSVRDFWIPGIKIKKFVVLRRWIKGFCPRIPVFLSKFVRDSHSVADPSARAKGNLRFHRKERGSVLEGAKLRVCMYGHLSF